VRALLRHALSSSKGFRRLTRKRALAGALALVVAGAWIRMGPLPNGLLDGPQETSTLVVDRHGRPLYEALAGDGTRSVTLAAATLPDTLVAATVAAEDRRFWSHPGVDPIALLRAARRNITERRIVEGGSTISQQVAKLLLNRQAPGRRREFRAKFREAVIALRLEHRFTKREVLAMYLNLAAYGNQITGAERASRTYFGRPTALLTPAQAAFLAGLPQRPSAFNPYRHPEAALARQRLVLRRMQRAGALSPDASAEALAERLTFAQQEVPFAAPHFVEMVLAAVAVPRPARIETTIDAELQADVNGIIRSHRSVLDKAGAANVAVVVLDNESGEWLAWEGSGNYFEAERGGSINGAITPRQPGSALKPFTYAVAFEEGFTPASVLADIPSHFPTAEAGVLYSPRNYDGRYRGPLLARRALAGSENVPAVALASEIGVPRLMRFLMRASMTTFDRNAAHYGLGVTLGNAEVKLAELVAAYAAFARGGDWMEPVFVAGRREGRNRRTLMSPRTAFWITSILSDAEAREYIFGRGGSLELPFPTAVKTGTSQAYHDNWTVGYTRRLTVGVWVGNFDRKPLRDSTGVTGAAPIFQAVMLAAARRYPPFDPNVPLAAPPEDVEPREVCTLSGMPANQWCPSRQREWLPREQRPLPCSWHHMSDEGVLTFWPPEFREWARENGRATDATPAPRAVATAYRTSDAEPATPDLPLRITSPADGAVYLVDPTLRREFQSLKLRVATDVPTMVEWTVDAVPLGKRSSESSAAWPLRTGTHRITARDARGHTSEAVVVVR
jgi:penicillin-binding protein 1C